MQRIPILDNGNEVSHLAAIYDTPTKPVAPDAAATAVLYLHGFGSSQSGTKASYFRRRFLDAGLAVCSFDFQGHGDSGGDMLGFTLSRNLSDVACARAWLAERGHSRLVLMGSSMGGGTALWHAAQVPENIAAAVHLAPSLEMHEGLLHRVGPENAERWQRDGKLRFDHELMSCDLSWELVEDLRTYDVPRLQGIYRTPTLIFQGKHDASVPWRAALDFTVGCEYEEIELHLMADAEHRMIDRTDHLWRVLRAFLERRGVLPSTLGAMASTPDRLRPLASEQPR